MIGIFLGFTEGYSVSQLKIKQTQTNYFESFPLVKFSRPVIFLHAFLKTFSVAHIFLVVRYP